MADRSYNMEVKCTQD